MLFVSNYHILVKFKGYKAATLLTNGSVHMQDAQVQKEIEENSSKVVAESQLHAGYKTVLFEQQRKEKNEDETHVAYVALRFNSVGEASKVGEYKDL